MSQLQSNPAVISHAFVPLPAIVSLRQLRRPLQRWPRHIPSVAATSPASKPTTKISLVTMDAGAGQISAQGPFCRFVDRRMLRHCVACAKKSKRAFAEPEACVASLLTEAKAAVKMAERGRSEQFFLRAIAVDPTHARSYFQYALQVQKRDPQLARDLFSLGVQQNPHDAKILQAWGLFESKQGYMERARRLLQRSVFLDPQNAPVLKWKCIFPQAI